MSIVLAGSTSGSITLQEPAVAGSTVLSLPATSGTLITTGSTGQVIPKAALPTGSVLQVVQTVKTDTFTTASTSFVDVTGLSVSITPTNSTSTILLFVSGVLASTSTTTGSALQLLRGSTNIATSTGGGTSNQTFVAYSLATGFGISFLDSPATTSSTTYKIQIRTISGGSSATIGRIGDNDGIRVVTTITAMEIAA